MRLKAIITAIIVVAVINEAAAQKDTIPDSKYYPAVGDDKNVALMLLGGYEGGLPTYYNTEQFTKLGYPCLVVGYFMTINTPDRLELIPLEYFEDVIKKFKSWSEIINRKIVVIGGSKGGELALLLGSRYKQIEGVIASVPGSVVFQGIGGRPVSSWSYNGESIPFVPYAPYDFSKIVNSQYVELYRLSLDQTEAVEEAIIKAENINGPVLLLSGKEDTMWPSGQMCEMIAERLKDNKFPFWYRHFSYENAGHTLNEQHLMGGTPEGNKKAREDSEQRILEFLDRLSKNDLHQD